MESIKTPETVESKIASLIAKRDALLENDDDFTFYAAALEHANMVEKAYADREKNARLYKALHVLNNSSVEDNETQPYYDFPEDEFSIEKFLVKKEKELLKK